MNMLQRRNTAALFCTLTLATSLTSCTTINPYTGEQQTAKATTGAVIGAVAGAIVGAATADKEKRIERALKGAGIGAITGGGAGYYMDVQEAKLRQKLVKTGVSVSRNGDQIILNMPGNITFDTNSTALKADFLNTLNGVILVLQEYQSTLVTVEGHTDSVGAETYNQTLSEKRAKSVSDYLQTKGVVVERLGIIGHGERIPAADNDTTEGRAQNRRVELVLDPIT